MMQIVGDLREKVQATIEEQADPNALPQLRAALATIDPGQADVIFSAAVELAGAWADAALVVGWRMAADPSAWLFAEQS